MVVVVVEGGNEQKYGDSSTGNKVVEEGKQ